VSEFLQSAYSGVLYGSVYGLMALGLTVIWGSMRLLNLAHGSLYLVGGYVAWTVVNQLSMPLEAAVPLAIAGAALAGLIMYGVFIRPLVGRPSWDSATLIATVGVGIAIEAAALLIYGPQVKDFPRIVDGSFIVENVLITHHGLLVIGIAAVCLVGVNAYMRASRRGMAIRAVSQDVDAAKLMGIPIDATFAIVIALSAALAGLAGVLLSATFYLSPTSGFAPMILAVVVTILGGLGSIKGTIVAAYSIGLIESFVNVYAGPSWGLPVLFGTMIVVLTVRPNGLFGVGEARRL
jgi:branched-chain amino acid transport system permease protein